MTAQTRHKDLPTIIEGDDAHYRLNITDGAGNPIDITGWTVFVTVKKSLKDQDSDAIIQKDISTHDDPTNGITSFDFTHTETTDLSGSMHYDIQLKKSDGTIQTILKGRVHFEADVTERITA